MFKNKFFRKVTSCFLTFAEVLCLSIPCNAEFVKGNSINQKLKTLDCAYDNIKNRNIIVKESNNIQFCEFDSRDVGFSAHATFLSGELHYGTFYMSSCVLEREYEEFKKSENQIYQNSNSEEIKRFIKYLSNKVGSRNHNSCFDSYNYYNCSYLFIINSEVKNEFLYNLINDNYFNYVNFIYEKDIDNNKDNTELKKKLFKKLGFHNIQTSSTEKKKELGFNSCDVQTNNQSNSTLWLSIGGFGVLSLVTLGFFAEKNISDSKLATKTKSISKKVMALQKNIVY
ncbi:MAG: hypothetical protein Q4B84_02720 [Clostridia bacterium]|nr:hypothetical protein [Clostridia bacterium]